jgi:hypothetical protein
MPTSHSKGPRAACVEDFDEDKNTVVSQSRVVAAKDGSDSGYSSRTGTVDGENPGSGKMFAVNPIERDRQPYSKVPGANRRELVNYQMPVRPKSPERPSIVKEPRSTFRHEPGKCYTCDQVGVHMTQEEFDQYQRREDARPVVAAEKPRPIRQSSGTPVKARPADSVLRRMSSHRESRPAQPLQPMSMPASAGYNTQQPLYQYATTPTSGAYAQSSYYMTPVVPGSNTYSGGVRQYEYTQGVPMLEDPNPARRPQAYTDPDRPSARSRNSYHQYQSPIDDLRKELDREQRLRREYDDRAAVDREMMPPPRLPTKQGAPVRRPSVRKSYTTDEPRSVQSRYRFDDNEYAVVEDGEYHEDRHRQQDSPPRSSNPQRASAAPMVSRPPARQSVSYSDPRSQSVKTIAKSSTRDDVVQRRATAPLVPADDKLAAQEARAEAHMSKRQSMTSHELSAEKLKSMNATRVPSRSEAGSHHGSHYSKHSTSSRARRESQSIVIEAPKNRPLSLDINGLKLKIDAEREKKETKSREPRAIEAAPASSTSYSSASRSRAATSSHASSEHSRDRDYHHESLTRVSTSDKRPPTSPVKVNSKSSKHSSRAPSRSRAASDVPSSRKHRESVSGSERYVYGG